MTTVLLLLALSAQAETSCLARVAERIAVVRPSFPALGSLELVLEPFESGDDFYQARPLSPWKEPARRVYAVRVNTKVCADAPPPEAERAILAHELAHLDAYSRMGRRGLLALGWAYTFRPEGEEVEAFEKAADDAVVKLGRAEGLAQYREWLYPRVTPAVAATKRKLYRTPEELRRALQPSNFLK